LGYALDGPPAFNRHTIVRIRLELEFSTSRAIADGVMEIAQGSA